MAGGYILYVHSITCTDLTKKHKASQRKARQATTRQGKIQQDRTSQGKTRYGKTRRKKERLTIADRDNNEYATTKKLTRVPLN